MWRWWPFTYQYGVIERQVQSSAIIEAAHIREYLSRQCGVLFKGSDIFASIETIHPIGDEMLLVTEATVQGDKSTSGLEAIESQLKQSEGFFVVKVMKNSETDRNIEIATTQFNGVQNRTTEKLSLSRETSLGSLYILWICINSKILSIRQIGYHASWATSDIQYS